jgi:hypothetical protein
VVQQAIDEGGGERGVVQDTAPLGQTLIRRDQGGLLLVAGGDDLVEDRADVGVSRQVAELIEDEDVARVIRLQDLGAPIEAGGAQDACEQRLDRREAYGVAALEQGQTDGRGEMGLAQPRGADETERPPLGDEAVIQVAQEDLAVGDVPGSVELES